MRFLIIVCLFSSCIVSKQEDSFHNHEIKEYFKANFSVPKYLSDFSRDTVLSDYALGHKIVYYYGLLSNPINKELYRVPIKPDSLFVSFSVEFPLIIERPYEFDKNDLDTLFKVCIIRQEQLTNINFVWLSKEIIDKPNLKGWTFEYTYDYEDGESGYVMRRTLFIKNTTVHFIFKADNFSDLEKYRNDANKVFESLSVSR